MFYVKKSLAHCYWSLDNRIEMASVLAAIGNCEVRALLAVQGHR